MSLNFFQKSVNECLEILIIIIVIKYRPCIQLHLCTLSDDFLISFVSSGQYQRGTFLHKAHWVLSMTFKSRL